MKVYTGSAPLIKVNLETEAENKIFYSDFLKSKICYQVVENGLGIENFQIELITKGNNEIFFNQKIAYLKSLSDNLKPTSYFLRVIFDALSIINNCLPLHAAALKVNNKSLIICGDTNSGKSTISFYHYKNFSSTLVGDDHIIIGNGLIVGNENIRLRQKNSKKEKFYHAGGEASPFSDFGIVNVKISTRNFSKMISIDEALKKYNLCQNMLKYFTNILYDQDRIITLPDCIDQSIINKYYEMFYQFLKKSAYVYHISGSLNFILHEMRKITI